MSTANEVVQWMLRGVSIPIPDRERGGFQTISGPEHAHLRFYRYNDGSILVERRNDTQTLDFRTYGSWDELVATLIGRA